jgi:hypothetical protein
MSKKRRQRSPDIDLFPPQVRCPVCQGPRRPVQGRFGPYFHCRCMEKARHQPPVPSEAQQAAGCAAELVPVG